MSDDLRIEQIAAAVTWRLRQEVLYPNGSLKDVMITEDFEGFHFGAYQDNVLVGVISLFPDEDGFQFRKFAVQPHVQGQGIGRNLLKYVFSFAKTWDCQMIWCHARETAITFYEKSGMRVAGSAFSKNGIAYVRMEIWL